MKLHQLAATALALTTALSAQTLYIPSNATAGTTGPGGGTSYPWNRDTATPASNDIRVQYLYDRSNFAGITQPIVITQLAFRAESTTTPWTGGNYTNCELRLGAGLAPVNATTSFAGNYVSGVDPTPVFTGSVTVLPDPAPLAAPAPGILGVTISGLNYLYDPTTEDLMVDIKHDGVFTGTTTGGMITDTGGAGGLGSRVYNLSDANAATGSIQANVAVVIEVTYQPSTGVFASFDIDKPNAGPGETVTFTSTSFTSDPAGFAALDWDFDGDGLTDATGPTASTTFANCGPNPVTLTATAANGTDMATNNVNIVGPTAAFDTTVVLPGIPLVLQFNDLSTGVPTTYDWDLDGDGVFGDSNIPNPQWVYVQEGLYPVSLTVSNACGSDTTTINIDTRSQICTQYARNNGGSDGGAVYFDLDITNPAGVTLTGLDSNVDDAAGTTGITMDVYCKTGSHVGSEANRAAWQFVGTSAPATAAGVDNGTPFDIPDMYLPMGQYALALVLSSTTGHDYTGTGSPPVTVVTGNDITLTTGAASNVPFTGSAFFSREWNGCLYYAVGSTTSASLTPLGGGCQNSNGTVATLGVQGGGPVLIDTLNVLEIQLGPLNATGGILFGFLNAGGVPLDAIGMTGCALYATPVVTLPASTDAVGSATSSLDIGHDPNAHGIPITMQAAFLDPGANAFGVVLSNAAGGTIGWN